MLAAQGVPMAPMDPIWLLRGCFWSPWGCIWLLRGSIWLQRLRLGALGAAYGRSEAPDGCPWGSIWLPMGLHMAAHRLHFAAEGWHFAAQGPSMAPMRQICSICCIWLGRAGAQDGREDGQVRLNGSCWAPMEVQTST